MQQTKTKERAARGAPASRFSAVVAEEGGRPSMSATGSHRSGETTRRGPRVRRDDVTLLATQLAIMLDTGVPLAEALGSVATRTTDGRFATLLDKVVESVEAGEPLSHALGQHRGSFPTIMIALLRASEASGTMSEMLERIAGYLAKEQQTIKKIRGAMAYPFFMFLMCIGITVFLLTAIMPRFVSIYEGRGAALPATTRFLMTLSGVLTEHWPVCIAGLIGLVITALIWARTKRGRQQKDWLKLHLPVMSGLVRKLYLSRGCRTLGTMVETGVPLLESITIVRDVTPNVYFERLWDDVDDALRQGRPMSERMFESDVIPDHVAQMIESGESAGRLGPVLSRVAGFCEDDFDQAVKTATQFIEPVMIVVMGSIIGFVAISLLIPIFGVGDVIAGG
ncbi:MAG: type II secretion system F family protein [Phycisphaerales bacterium]|nr:type II secretion system F family protein [Phycisphaerae bacterium]NNF41625.1 type II secretion system F family protein [Phycisphaerales bacterium]NNM24575.1 type II secretion system F family protein [Phycisphaerales bacterium]